MLKVLKKFATWTPLVLLAAMVTACTFYLAGSWLAETAPIAGFELAAAVMLILLALNPASWRFAQGLRAFTFTNAWFTADFELWNFTSAIGDASAVLAFKNTYTQAPAIILSATDNTLYANSIRNSGTNTTVGATITQTTSVSAGAGQILVMRSRK